MSRLRRVVGGLVTVALALLVAAPSAAGANWKPGRKGPQTFLKSGDYKDDDEVVGQFLTDEHYALMIEDLEFRDRELDWAWVKAAGSKPKKPERLLFAIGDYHSVRVPEVVNVADAITPDGLEAEVRGYFVSAFERLGLEVVTGPEAEADLELGLAIVDYKADSTFFYFGSADPFIELELILTDLAGDEPLLIARHQDHNKTPALGAADTAAELLRWLR